jgi:hypothetical protein
MNALVCERRIFRDSDRTSLELFSACTYFDSPSTYPTLPYTPNLPRATSQIATLDGLVRLYADPRYGGSLAARLSRRT